MTSSVTPSLADAQARERRAAWWMLLAAAAFAPMAACVKLATQHYGVAEVLAVRGLVGVLAFGAAAWFSGVSLRTGFGMRHFQRGVIGLCAVGGWFYALSLLPLATAYILYHTSSLWIAAGVLAGAVWRAWQGAGTETEGSQAAMPALGRASSAAADWSMATVTTKSILKSKTLTPQERMRAIFKRQWPLAAALALGFAGVALLLLPGLRGASTWGYAVGALAGCVAAWAMASVARLGRLGEPNLRIGFWFMALTGIVGLVLTVGVAQVQGAKSWSTPHALWAWAAGCLAVVGQWAMTNAFARGSPLLAANLQYSGVLFAVLIGAVFFGETITLIALAGMAVIVASAVLASLVRANQDRASARV